MATAYSSRERDTPIEAKVSRCFWSGLEEIFPSSSPGRSGGNCSLRPPRRDDCLAPLGALYPCQGKGNPPLLKWFRANLLALVSVRIGEKSLIAAATLRRLLSPFGRAIPSLVQSYSATFGAVWCKSPYPRLRVDRGEIAHCGRHFTVTAYSFWERDTLLGGKVFYRL